MSSLWQPHPSETQTLSLADLNDHHHHHQHHQHHHHHHQHQQQRLYRPPFDSNFYKKQQGGKVATNGRHHLPKASSCSNNNNNINVNNACKAILSKRVVVDPEMKIRNDDDDDDDEENWRVAVNCPPTSNEQVSVIAASARIIGKSFADVVASSARGAETKMATPDDDVDDGFEDGTSGSPGINSSSSSSTNSNHVSAESSTDVTSVASDNGDGKVESSSSSSANKVPSTIKDIPDRFKRLLKAAADKATAQRLRVEGAPLIRGPPQDALPGFLQQPHQPAIQCDGQILSLPSYPVAVGLQQQAVYCHPGVYEGSVDIGCSSQKPSVQAGPYGPYDPCSPLVGCCPSDFNCDLHAKGLPYPSLVPYGHLAYHVPSVHPYSTPAYVSDGSGGLYYCAPGPFYDCNANGI